MSAALTHAAVTFRVAAARGNRLKALALTASAGFALFLVTLSDGIHLGVRGLVLLVLAMGAVPAWRGLLWLGGGSTLALPLGRRTQAGVEGLVFGVLLGTVATLLTLLLFWTAASPEEAGSYAVSLATALALCLPATLLASPLRPAQVSTPLWALLSLPGLAGLVLALGLAFDGPPRMLSLAAGAMGLALLGGVVVGSFWAARRVRDALGSGTRAIHRPGLPGPERLARDTRVQLLTVGFLVSVGTLVAWLGVFAIDREQWRDPDLWWLGPAVVAPMVPRLLALLSALGLSSGNWVGQPGAARLLPVHPKTLRRSVALVLVVPVLLGVGCDLLATTALTDIGGAYEGILHVNLWTSAALLVGVALALSRVARS